MCMYVVNMKKHGHGERGEGIKSSAVLESEGSDMQEKDH